MTEQKGIKIYIVPKIQFEAILKNNKIDDTNVDTFKDYCFICINQSTGTYFHEPILKEEHYNVLNLWFDDVEADMMLEGIKAFSYSDAEKIIEFLDNNKKVKILIVHCSAGISRSGAVGTFALDYLNGDKEFFKNTNPHILPNNRVMRMLNEMRRK
jgi:predicted protein tyrosine phosphatase